MCNENQNIGIVKLILFSQMAYIEDNNRVAMVDYRPDSYHKDCIYVEVRQWDFDTIIETIVREGGKELIHHSEVMQKTGGGRFYFLKNHEIIREAVKVFDSLFAASPMSKMELGN